MHRKVDSMSVSYASVFSADVETAVVWPQVADNQRTAADI